MLVNMIKYAWFQPSCCWSVDSKMDPWAFYISFVDQSKQSVWRVSFGKQIVSILEIFINKYWL